MKKHKTSELFLLNSKLLDFDNLVFLRSGSDFIQIQISNL